MDGLVIFCQSFGKCPVFVKVVQMGAPENGVDIDMPEEYLVAVVLGVEVASRVGGVDIKVLGSHGNDYVTP